MELIENKTTMAQAGKGEGHFASQWPSHHLCKKKHTRDLHNGMHMTYITELCIFKWVRGYT